MLYPINCQSSIPQNRSFFSKKHPRLCNFAFHINQAKENTSIKTMERARAVKKPVKDDYELQRRGDFGTDISILYIIRQNEACSQCDADPGKCRKIQGIYTVRTLPLGYNAVLTIPRGACHINVSELNPSRNYLALKTFDGTSIINGDWELSPPGSYPGAGTRFLYSRRSVSCKTECIQSTGPLAQNITIQVVYYSPNEGILYEFLLPSNVTIPSLTNPVKLQPNANKSRTKPVIHGNKGSLTRPHGGQSYLQRTRDLKQSQIMGEVEIITNPRELQKNRQYYNGRIRHRIEPSYIPSSTSGGYQRQELRGRGVVQRFNDVQTNNNYRNNSLGSNTIGYNVVPIKNVVGINTTQSLDRGGNYNTNNVHGNHINNIDSLVFRWSVGNWTTCSVPCGKGSQNREVVCQQKVSDTELLTVNPQYCDQSHVPLTTRECYRGPCGEWIVGEWGQCSVRCGLGQQRRRVECKTQSGVLLPSSLCTQNAPNKTRSCDTGPCQYKWIFSSWQKQCRNKCGNTTRKVRCATSAGSVVDDSHCDASNKPKGEKECSNTRMCTQDWYTGPWGKCSVTCGAGVKSRDVMCINIVNNSILRDDECDSRTKPVTRKRCNHKACGSSWFMTDWSQCSAKCDGGTKVRSVLCLNENKQQSRRCVSLKKPKESKQCNIKSCRVLANITDSSCADTYGHCALVVRARLCQYKYYRQMCCHSCTISDVTGNT
ncbi:hypothetical protein FSP39_015226 [Pinctada imbricata]|uniref:PLAC domain-containing protein n=1 Tax=Pinctada imbricata TaxID=66713 RepID=A0AA88YB62_PINIB|nr:hypothetical protein FSP39_015226 [Pinctada imbricata]